MKPNIVCGLDEAGRGSLAGPIFAAAVIIDHKQEKLLIKSKLDVRDSKIISPLQRLKIWNFILDHRIFYKLYSLDVNQIDKYGIGQTNIYIFKKLIFQITADKYIVDGNLKLNLPDAISPFVKSIPHADSYILPVILAGIIAKVNRDKYMEKLHLKFPNYFWSNNKGYGTKQHLNAVLNYGPNKHHRQLFIKTAINNIQKNKHMLQ
jgi:ribonuclease HII